MKPISALALVFLAGIFAGSVTTLALRPPVTNTIVIPSEDDRAKGVLIDFLAALNAKDYAKAAAAYGGEYETLRSWNPAVDPSDLVTLWKHGCEMNGLNCLEIRNLAFASRPEPDRFIFDVWFSQEDKTKEFMHENGASKFPFAVKRDVSGVLRVETMPVYSE